MAGDPDDGPSASQGDGWFSRVASAWSSTRDGRGAYRQVPSGAPHALLEAEESCLELEQATAAPPHLCCVPAGARASAGLGSSRLCAGLAAVALASGAAFAFMALPSAQSNSEAPLRQAQMLLRTTTPCASAVGPSYSCTGEATFWSSARRAYCCQNSGVGCDAQAPAAPQYDCNGGYMAQIVAWDHDKRSWCCTNRGRGCGAVGTTPCPSTGPVATPCPPSRPTPPPPMYDCQAGLLNWEKGWSDGKKSWCCSSYKVGCPTPVVTTTPCTRTYDCDAGYANWRRGWSIAKKEWCCSHYGRGCHVTTTVLHEAHDCAADLTAWQNMWTSEKKTWCCHRYKVGCDIAVTTTAGDFYDCSSGDPHSWSSAKQTWCCDDVGKGCHETTTSVKYDCSKGYPHWVNLWSFGKKEYCCRHYGSGCTTTTGFPTQSTRTAPFDCSLGWTSAWPHEKKVWCCRREGLGCPASTTTLRYDCDNGASAWQSSWSLEKQTWCCSRVGKGCPSTTKGDFDCDAGYANWQRGWSVEKKAWCCSHVGKGCSNNGGGCSKPYDCNTGPDTPESTWSDEKRAWCCNHAGRGCSYERSDCYKDDIEPHDWPVAKKKWCCEQVGQGCSAPCLDLECTFDCSVGYDNWQVLWNEAKKAYCCRALGKGCQAETSTTRDIEAPYDCFTGTEGSWSVDQKQYCCAEVGKGCDERPPDPPDSSSLAFTTTPAVPVATTTTGSVIPDVGVGLPEPPDPTPPPLTTTTLPNCNEGLENWQTSWDQAKKDWCCDNKGVGCPTQTVTTTKTATTSTTSGFGKYDCEKGFEDWESEWDPVHKAWCCEHTGKGCTDPKPESCSDFQCPKDHVKKADADKLFCATATCQSADAATCCEEEVRLPSTPSCSSFKCPDNYFLKEGADNLFCNGDPCDVAVDTLRCCDEALTCDLNCYGEAATAVDLQPATGADGDMTMEECQETCMATDACEAIVYGKDSKQCFGKKDVHTSKCQPGESWVTQVLKVRPWGKCVLMGDPHIIPFDRPLGPHVNDLIPGEYWLIKSAELILQGRFDVTQRFPKEASTVGIAVGGQLVGDHSLVVEYVGGNQSGAEGFAIYYDGKRIFGQIEAAHGDWSWNSGDNDVQAAYGPMDPSKWHRDARHTIGGTEGDLPSFLFNFKKSGMNIYILVGPDNFNAVIEAKKAPGSQDGWCGNFNCNGEDDSAEALRARGVGDHLDPKQSLFKSKGSQRPAPPALAEAPEDALDSCDKTVKAAAEEKCKGLPEGERKGCIFDACAAGDAAVAEEDASIGALAEEVEDKEVTDTK